jgi:DGQHR domain-containing protein
MAESAADPHRQKAVAEVRRVFVKAGFPQDEISIQGPTEEGPDLVLLHHGEDGSSIKVLVQVKRADRQGQEFGSLGQLVRDYASYVQDFGADVALLVLERYSIPDRFRDRVVMERIRKTKRVVYWDSGTFAFYKKTTRILGAPYSKFFVLSDLGFHIRFLEREIDVPALLVKQRPRGVRMWLFSIEPDRFLKLAYVFHRGTRDPEAYQRILKPTRLKAMGRFFAGKETRGKKVSGILPNSLLVALPNSVTFTGGKLHIPAKSCSIAVIDGQHRLYGFPHLPRDMSDVQRRGVLNKFSLTVVGIKADEKLQAKLFTEINSSQERINRNLLLDLFYFLEIEDEPGVIDRVGVTKKLAKTPLFRGKLKILSTDTGRITLAGLVDYERMRQLSRELGNRIYTIFHAYFEVVSRVFATEWNDSESRYILATSRGIRMLLSLLVRINEYAERRGLKLSTDVMQTCLNALRETTASDNNYFAVANYKGKALGAGAPDRVATELWGSRIDMKLGDFLSQAERHRILGAGRDTLEKLEKQLREVIEGVLSGVSQKWWQERVPDDVRRNAEQRQARNESPWPWYSGGAHPRQAYLNFPAYAKIIISQANWGYFRHYFKDRTITEAKLKELEPVRNDIAHNRQLTPERFEHLKLYCQDLLACVETWRRERTTSQTVQTVTT